MLNEMVRRKVKAVANLGVSCFYNHVLMCFLIITCANVCAKTRLLLTINKVKANLKKATFAQLTEARRSTWGQVNLD